MLFIIGANGSDSREEGSGLACWPPSLTGEPSLTVSMEDYWSLSRWAFPIENYWIASMELSNRSKRLLGRTIPQTLSIQTH